ncbi:hypothetical protein QR297_11545 [Pseudomonas shirazica]|uniref:TniQ protein n=1 Tax=Pseudomonas shirazica TaxID=1940636 RepID=A0ABY9SV91_9PSED|nr:hypothetical protein [Pseudomonas shirazica]WMY87439.1 hypothetical protein QR297_11545 [Pseudomonas shirazica]
MSVSFNLVPDETFSSWLYRQSIFDPDSLLSFDQVTECFRRSSQVQLGDLDFDSKTPFVLECCQHLNLSSSLFSQFFAESGEWRIPRFYRRSFCYVCFCYHIDEYAHPALLKNWSRVFYTVCELHQAPMYDSADRYGYKLDAAIELFKYYHTQGNLLRVNLLRSFQHQDELLGLAARTQSYLSDAEELASYSNCADASALWAFCKLLLEILLHARYGLIYQFLGSPHYSDDSKPFRYRLHMGAMTANIIQRRAAVIILGYIMSVYRAEEIEILQQFLALSPIARLRLKDVRDMGRFSNVFSPSQSSVVAAQLQRYVEYLAIPSATDFVAGFTQGRK